MAKTTRGQRSRVAITTLVVAVLASTAAADASSERTARASTQPPTVAGAPAATPTTVDNWTTYHHDQLRQGYDPMASPASGHLSTAWTTHLDGAVYGEPLVVFGKVIAVTENDSIYGLSMSGRVLWRRHVGSPLPLSQLPCGDIDPLGITGTPIYHPSTHQVYVAAELNHPIRHRLFAVNPKTGHVDWSRQIDPPAMARSAQQERGALAISHGRVWVPFGGLAGDCGPYHGWVVGTKLSGVGPVSIYRQPSSREAGIWAPSGPAVDASGHLFVAIGNGAALAPPYDDSDSILELDGTHKVSLFAPRNWAAENANDLDLGSTGPMIFGALGHHWAFGDGKAGDGYLLHQRHLGGIGGYAATIANCKSFGGTAYRARTIYVPCLSGLSAYRLTSGPVMRRKWHNTSVLYGASPVVGAGAIWAVYNGGLFQLDPRNGRTVARATLGGCPHFATPTLHGSLVLVGTLSGVTAVSTR
jgi:hypothetical protein